LPWLHLPNAFGQYDQTPEEMQQLIREYLQENLVNIIGGCCGTTPEHIKLIAEEAKATGKEEAKNFSIAPIVTDYLSLKNALASDNDKAAANAGKKLLGTLNKVDMKTIPADKHKEFMEIFESAKENAEHIGENAGKIDHQREHLASLSEDLKDLVSLFGTSQTLYQDHCPMFNDGKGAVWFSENKEIKNPYYGSKMLTCGKVEKTINSK
jgi:rubrerythrin